MHGANIAFEPLAKDPLDDDLFTMDFTLRLAASQTIASAEVVEAPSGITIGSPSVNGAALTLEGRTIAIGKAVQFTISGGASGAEYKIKIRATTNDGRKKVCAGRLFVSG